MVQGCEKAVKFILYVYAQKTKPGRIILKVALGEYMNFKFLIARICYPGWWF